MIDRRAELLEPIVAQFRDGVNALLDRVERETDLVLADIEAELQQVSRAMCGQAAGAALAVKRWAVEAAARCPQCGAVPRDKGVQRRCQETRVGLATWERRYVWCPHCRRGWYPLDIAAGIAPGRGPSNG